MFCINCGNRLEDGDVFCPNCGQRVENPEESLGLSRFEDNSPAYDNHYQRVIDVNPVHHANNETAEDMQDKSFERYVIAATGGIGFSWVVVILLNLLNRAMYIVGGIIPYFSPFSSLLSLLMRALYIINNVFIWGLIAFAIFVISGLIYLLTRRRPQDSKQMIIIGIVDAALVLTAALLYMLPIRYYGAHSVLTVLIYIVAIVSIVLGIDLFTNVFIEKNNLFGKFDLSDDFALIKARLSKPAVKVDSSHYTDANIPHYEMTAQHEQKDSYFDGVGGELFVKYILLYLISMVSCGLAAPVMLNSIVKWEVEHTVIEGKRLTFNGTAGQLFGLFLKWICLSLITCGFYVYFAVLDFYKWKTKHTSYAGTNPIQENGPYRDCFFDGNVAETIGYMVLFSVITGVTCGLGIPWAMSLFTGWEKKSTVINRDRYFFDGDGGSMFGEYIVVWLLNIITCGIYSAWGNCKIQRYLINHTHIDARWKM